MKEEMRKLGGWGKAEAFVHMIYIWSHMYGFPIMWVVILYIVDCYHYV